MDLAGRVGVAVCVLVRAFFFCLPFFFFFVQTAFQLKLITSFSVKRSEGNFTLYSLAGAHPPLWLAWLEGTSSTPTSVAEKAAMCCHRAHGKIEG